MPAKRKYLLNDQELKNEPLYRKFSYISQYQPLVLLLGLSMLACGILLILFFALQLVSLHFRKFKNSYVFSYQGILVFDHLLTKILVIFDIIWSSLVTLNCD